MGYYDDRNAGVETGGADAIEMIDSVNVGNTLMREQRTVRRTTVKNGVSLTVAQGKTSTRSSKSVDLSAGTWTWPTPNASGISVKYSYSQIADSNLYLLTEEREEFQKRLLYRNTSSGIMESGNWASLP